jgi:rfaE bifunctional protein kinase chain/domain
MSISLPRAQELLAAFSLKRVLVIGDAFVDSYTEGVIERLNPESHHVHLLRVGREPIRYRSGGAGNVARNVASLGGRARLLSLCGTDLLGEQSWHIAQQEGYEAEFVMDSTRATIEKRRYITKDGVLLRVDYESEESLRPMNDAFAPQLLHLVKEKLSDIDAVLVSDYAKGMLTKKVCTELLDLLEKHSIVVLADVKPEQAGYFYGATMVAPNLKEASESLGKTANSKPEEIAPLLARRFSTEVFLTAGAQGICVASEHAGVCMVKQSHRVKVGDTSGCGDTAATTILLSKLVGATSEEAAELANAAAAVTVTMVGAYAPTPAEVLRMLAS